MFTVKFETENAAFAPEDEGMMTNVVKRDEAARILRNVAKRLQAGENYGTIMDVNGNKIGKWEID